MRATQVAAVAGLVLATSGSAFAATHRSATKEPFRTLAHATKETPIHYEVTLEQPDKKELEIVVSLDGTSAAPEKQ